MNLLMYLKKIVVEINIDFVPVVFVVLVVFVFKVPVVFVVLAVFVFIVPAFVVLVVKLLFGFVVDLQFDFVELVEPLMLVDLQLILIASIVIAVFEPSHYSFVLQKYYSTLIFYNRNHFEGQSLDNSLNMPH